jgi:hypothetical protein
MLRRNEWKMTPETLLEKSLLNSPQSVIFLAGERCDEDEESGVV